MDNTRRDIRTDSAGKRTDSEQCELYKF